MFRLIRTIIGHLYYVHLQHAIFPLVRSHDYIYIYILTYSMVQSPSWEANWFAASQEIPRILWNPNVLYRIHTCPSPVHILSQIDPVRTTTSHFLKIHLNIILPSTPASSKWSPSGFRAETLYTPLLSPNACYMPLSSLLDLIARTVLPCLCLRVHFPVFN